MNFELLNNLHANGGIMQCKNSEYLNYASSELNLTPSLENYIKAIYILNLEKRIIRVKDIAERMNHKMPSVCSALKRLEVMGLIVYEKYEHIEFTVKGEIAGSCVSKKFDCLYDFLRKILMLEGPGIAAMACEIEHGVSHDVYLKIERLIAFFEHEKSLKEAWVQRYEKYLS